MLKDASSKGFATDFFWKSAVWLYGLQVCSCDHSSSLPILFPNLATAVLLNKDFISADWATEFGCLSPHYWSPDPKVTEESGKMPLVGFGSVSSFII